MTAPIAKIKGVLFDMDGLLLDSEGVYTKVINEVLVKYGKEQTWPIKSQIMGKPEIEATETLLSLLWPPTKPGEIYASDCPFDVTSFLAERNKNLDAEFSKVGAMPGAERLVAHLAKHGVPICVATGSKRKNCTLPIGQIRSSDATLISSSQNCIFHLSRFVSTSLSPLPPPAPSHPAVEIKTTNHNPFFSHFDSRIVCGDDPRISRGKPYPDVFLLAAREGLRLEAQFGDVVRKPGVEFDEGATDSGDWKKALKGGEGQFLVFEDGQPGVIAASRAGMHSVWVPDPNLRELLSKEELGVADEVLGSLEDFEPEKWGLPAYD